MSGPVVVKIGGVALDEIGRMADLWRTLGAAHAAGGLIVVHGGGKSVDRQLAALGFESSKRDGVRITPPEQIETIVGVLAGVVNTQLVAALRGYGAPAVGVSLADAGTVVVGEEDRLGPGLGCVGRVVSGDGTLFATLLEGGFLPVVSSIGVSTDGALLNVNADEAAEGVAECVGAEALVMLTDVAGVLDADGGLVSRLDAGEVETLIASGVIRGGMAAKVRAASAVAERLAMPVRIGDVNEAAELVGGRAGVGTLVEPTRART